MKKKITFPMALDINENKVDIDSSFSTLHDITGVFYDECYSPVWRNTETLDSENVLFDKKGNRFEIKNNALYRNNRLVTEIDPTSYRKEDYEPTTNVFDVVNNKEAYVTVSDLNIPTIHYNGSTIEGTQPLFTTGAIVHSRVKIINGTPVYVAVYYDDNNNAKVYTLTDGVEQSHTFSWRANTYVNSSNHPAPGYRTATTEQKVLYEPIIFISSYDNDVLVTVTNNAGQPMKTTDFYYDSYIIHSGSVIDTLAFSTSSIPVIVNVTENITVLSVYDLATVTSTGLPAYSNDNGATFHEAKDITSPAITFDAGYVPTEVSDDGTWKTFNYVKTDTTFSFTLTGDGNLHNMVGVINFSGSSAPRQDTESVAITTEGTAATYTYTYNGAAAIQGITPSITFDYYNNVQTAAQKTSVTIPQQYLNYNYTFVNEYSTSANATTGVNPNIFNDDGNMWCLFEAEQDVKTTTANSYSIPFECRITGITYSGTTATIAYSVTKEGHFDNTYCVYRAASIALGQNWCREVVTWSSKTGTELAQNTAVVNAMDEIFDSGADAVKYSAGVLTNNTYYEKTYSGSTDVSVTANAMPYHNAGSRVRLNDYWNIVYANNLRVGLSSSSNAKQMGTMVTEWNDIHSDTYVVADGTNLYYQKANRDWVKVSIVNDNSFKLIENKYLVINTTSYWNCYDIEKEKLYHYATDYTNRCLAGTTSKTNNPFFSGRVGISSTVVATTAINANYLVTNEGVSSVSIGPSPYQRLVKGTEDFIGSSVPNNGEKIDVYYSNNGTTAAYVYSYIIGPYNKVRTINPDMIGIQYPLSTGAYTLYSPNIFTEYLITYNNRDAVINGDLAYQLIFANNTMPILLYSTATQLENVQAIFVIQSQFYGIIDDKIYALIYSNGTLMEADCIIDITGMQYLGGLPTIAYFYSPMNRSFYSFTGDANLALLYETTDIHEVYMTKYNTGTQTLYICTDKGVYLISSMCMTRLDIKDVEEIYFTDKGWCAIRSTNDDHSEHYLQFISYYKLTDDYTPSRMTFETKLFGGGEKTNSNINKYQITLLNHGYKTPDVIKWKVATLTDVGAVQIKENEQTINPDDWDIYNQYQLDITPNMVKGQGVAVTIDTPWAINNIVADVISDSSVTVVKPFKQSI